MAIMTINEVAKAMKRELDGKLQSHLEWPYRKPRLKFLHVIAGNSNFRGLNFRVGF